MKLLGIISVGFDVTDQLLIRFSAFVRYWRINGSTIRQYISYSYFKYLGTAVTNQNLIDCDEDIWTEEG
jgi:hypothetical protein